MLLLAVLALLSINADYTIYPTWPKKHVEREFHQSRQGFLERWEAFSQGRTFTPFEPGKGKEVLQQEFLKIQATREAVWFSNPDEIIKESALGYEAPASLIFQDGVRAKNCIAFAYNNTVPYYNASTVYVGSQPFIACEGPRSKDIPNFFQMLTAYRVTHLVRLTGSYEGEKKKCHPYWEGLLKSGKEGALHMEIPLGDEISYPVRAIITEEWKDNHGIDPKILLMMVLQLRQELAEKGGLAVVHCSAGVGRTGTFLASLAIVDAIDRGLPFSIEEIVYQLSLQRIHAVGQASQYITLHRLAEEYIQCKASS